MADKLKWRPFLRQISVVLGASINIGEASVSGAYTAVLLLQIRRPDSEIVADIEMQSWIAAISTLTVIVGNFVGGAAMGKFGRKRASITALSATLVGWISIALSTTVTALLLVRALQGVSLGMGLVIAPVMVAEYSSPRNRAAFVSTMLVIVSLLVLTVHTTGAYNSWQITALIFSVITFLGIVCLIYTPESPSWLADKERYDECENVFRWLRGTEAEDELQKLIEARKLIKEMKQSTPSQIKSTTLTLGKIRSLITRREFYIPIFIMFHLNTLARWSGLAVLMSYPMDAFSYLIGSHYDFGYQISLLDTSRVVANIIGIYATKKIRRRLLLLMIVGLNTCVLFAMTLYSYFKTYNMLLFDHPLIGIVLCHMLIITIVTGAISVPFVIIGELFPLEFRSFAAGLSSAIYSINMFISVKIFPYLLNTLGFHVTIFIHGAIVGYCLIAALAVLPETKDRTLQDIEDDLKGNREVRREPESAIPLTS